MHRRSDSSPLCKRCRRINLNALFRRSHLTKVGEEVQGWEGPVDQANLDSCPLCQLVMKTFRRSKEEMIENEKQLRSFSSRRIMDQGWASIDTTLLSLDQYHHYGIPYIVSQSKHMEIVRLLGPRTNFDLVKSWLRYCRTRHGKTCATVRGNDELGMISSLKFIDCDTNTIIPANGMPYIALSYLWGGGLNSAVSSVNSLPDDVPKTIKDAMTATRAMGFRYLWVDRYCINQSCQEEVAEQVHKMDLIYNHAELTIIAAGGTNAEYGLPGVSPRQVIQPSAKIGKHHLVSSMTDPRMLIGWSAWNKRGWTYQEGLLSRRRLVFTDHQVYFECCGMYCFEVLKLQMSALHLKDSTRFKASFCDGVNLGIFPRDLGRTEWEVVERITEYSAKSLTNPSDVLDGMSGVLRVLKQGPHKIRHCKGVPILPRPPKPSGLGPKEAEEIYHAYEWSPTVGFCAGLCWDVKNPVKRRHGFPSWSWAGWEGRVKWAFDEHEWRQLRSTSDIQFKVQLECGEECDLDEYFHKCGNHHMPISDRLLCSGLVAPIQLASGPSYDKIEAVAWTVDSKPVKWRFNVTEQDLDVRAMGACLAIELARQISFPNRHFTIVAEIECGVYQRVGFTGGIEFWAPKIGDLAKIQMDFSLM
ncbi:HET domain-containing protein [Fusarium falciforme]|uniref:HET domain-containing protein n=1 Tax=Fusarium falciforme TaxID=195108 RepID=UPI0023008C95|nr:HET domain-containing protein [Fusarium falciforme]WAO96205.1 HET domain-containing protein [Fusarium falciforme]